LFALGQPHCDGLRFFECGEESRPEVRSTRGKLEGGPSRHVPLSYALVESLELLISVAVVRPFPPWKSTTLGTVWWDVIEDHTDSRDTKYEVVGVVKINLNWLKG
jgi:hypothetical protein